MSPKFRNRLAARLVALALVAGGAVVAPVAVASVSAGPPAPVTAMTVSTPKADYVRGESLAVTVTVARTFGVKPTGRVVLTHTNLATGKVITTNLNLVNGATRYDTRNQVNPGENVFSAAYAGDDTYDPAVEETSVQVTKGATTTTAIAPASVASGAAASIKAQTSITAPAKGSLTAKATYTATNGTTTLTKLVGTSGTGLSAVWAPKLANGTWTITAAYPGNTDFDASTSAPATIQVGPVPNRAPTAAFTVQAGTSDRQYLFDGSGSTDVDGTILNYSWAFGDGTTATGAVADHTYESPGTYTATLTVTDDLGATGSTNAVITVAAAAESTVDQSYDNSSTGGSSIIGPSSGFGSGDEAQTFTAGRTGELDKVSMKVSRSFGSTGGLQVKVYALVDGQPSGPVLGSGSEPVGSATGFTDIVLTTPADVVAGSEYVVVLSTPGDEYWILLGAALDNGYPGGRGMYATTTGGVLSGHPDLDFSFKTWVR